MTPPRGSLYLVPNTLDFGVDGAHEPDLRELLPGSVIHVAARLTHWVVENAKSARAFLKRVDAVEPLAHALQTLSIVELPRPPKGTPNAAAADLGALLEPAHRSLDIGLISEAGLPAVADPGAALVQSAHAAGIRVVPLAGASALALALAASGLNGQCFAFVGYLPVQGTARGTRIRELESLSRRALQTQLMIETPYRNDAMLGALLQHLSATTRLSVSSGLTLSQGFTRTDTVQGWRDRPTALSANLPTVFAFLAS